MVRREENGGRREARGEWREEESREGMFNTYLVRLDLYDKLR